MSALMRWVRQRWLSLGVGAVSVLWFVRPEATVLLGGIALLFLPGMLGMMLFGMGPKLTLSWLLFLVLLFALVFGFMVRLARGFSVEPMMTTPEWQYSTGVDR